MNILILGGGGREHALAWAVLQNPKCDRLIVAPGNAGIARIAECADIAPDDIDAVLEIVAAEAIGLVIVGPEAPLAAGVADACAAAGVPVFGPSQAAARLETSKAFAKGVCDAAGIPTAAWTRFEDTDAARAHVRSHGAPIVVKADGLAAGKGVTVAATVAEAEAALTGPGPWVLEEVLEGEEASLFVLADGETALVCGTAQDHKRAHDGDTGPNTGGMGAYSPAPVLSAPVVEAAMARIVRPGLAEMARRGTPYRGVLYAGLMIADGAPSLIEFNARFGDPEAQVLMMRLGGQALDLMHAVAEGRLADMAVRWAEDHALCVVIAAEGYPAAARTGAEIGGVLDLPQSSRAALFHAGTVQDGAQVRVAGGRVLGATARADTLAAARDAAYALAAGVTVPGGFYRRDIGWRALDPGAI